MKTVEEIFDELLEAVNDRSKTYIEDFIREIQAEAYNQAIEDVIELIIDEVGVNCLADIQTLKK